ncbi:hypothetical protein BDW75DRAFT_213952 [Aspergillus navahoensis]
MHCAGAPEGCFTSLLVEMPTEGYSSLPTAATIHLHRPLVISVQLSGFYLDPYL